MRHIGDTDGSGTAVRGRGIFNTIALGVSASGGMMFADASGGTNGLAYLS